jgi:hypothetical protein
MKQDIPIGSTVMVDYKYAEPHPYEGIVKEYSSAHNTYRVASLNAPWYDPWLDRKQLSPLWSIEHD